MPDGSALERLLEAARAHRAAGRADAARRALADLLDQHPDHAEALVEFIAAAVELGQPALAHARVASYIQARPFASDMLRLFVQLSGALERWDDAATALEKLVLLETRDAVARELQAARDEIRRTQAAGAPPGPSRAMTAGARRRVLLVSLASPPSITSFYERAFRRHHDVVSVGPLRDRAFWEQYAEGLKGHAFYREGSAEAWVDACARLTEPCDIVTAPGFIDMRDVLTRLPAGFEPDLFVWVDQDRFTMPVRLDALGCPTVALMGDTHLGLEWRLRLARGFDHVFVMFNRQHMAAFEHSGCPSVHWCPAAVDPDVHVACGAGKVHDVTFVGSTHPQLHRARVERLRALAAAGVDVFVDARPLGAMTTLFAASRIVLNDTVADDLNMRVFEALGSGSLLLTSRLPATSGLEDLFRDGEHLVLWDGTADLLEKIRYYLDEAHAGERERIAAAGQAEVLARHTYDDRVAQVVAQVSRVDGLRP